MDIKILNTQNTSFSQETPRDKSLQQELMPRSRQASVVESSHMEEILQKVEKLSKEGFHFIIPSNTFKHIALQDRDKIRQLIIRTKVFARMKPNQKSTLIEMLQH